MYLWSENIPPLEEALEPGGCCSPPKFSLALFWNKLHPQLVGYCKGLGPQLSFPWLKINLLRPELNQTSSLEQPSCLANHNPDSLHFFTRHSSLLPPPPTPPIRIFLCLFVSFSKASQTIIHLCWIHSSFFECWPRVTYSLSCLYVVWRGRFSMFSVHNRLCPANVCCLLWRAKWGPTRWEGPNWGASGMSPSGQHQYHSSIIALQVNRGAPLSLLIIHKLKW